MTIANNNNNINENNVWKLICVLIIMEIMKWNNNVNENKWK